MAWNDDHSWIYVASPTSLLLTKRDGVTLTREAVLVHDLGDGLLGYGDGWLYYATLNGTLLAVKVEQAGNLETRGPVAVGDALGIGVRVQDVTVYQDTLLIAGWLVEPVRMGAVVALNVSSPGSIDPDPSSLRVLYRLEFNSTVLDVLARDGFLYVAEGSGVLHVYDTTTMPPSRVTWHSVPRGFQGMDIRGTLLAGVDGWTNRLLSYRIQPSQFELLSEISLAGQPIMVTLEEGLAYVSVHPDGNFLRGIAVFETTSTGITRLLTTHDLGGFGGTHLSNRSEAYSLGSDDVAIIRQVERPILVTYPWFAGAILASVITTAIVVIGGRARRKSRGQGSIGRRV